VRVPSTSKSAKILFFFSNSVIVEQMTKLHSQHHNTGVFRLNGTSCFALFEQTVADAALMRRLCASKLWFVTDWKDIPWWKSTKL
jgi:hypothetical protein